MTDCDQDLCQVGWPAPRRSWLGGWAGGWRTSLWGWSTSLWQSLCFYKGGACREKCLLVVQVEYSEWQRSSGLRVLRQVPMKYFLKYSVNIVLFLPRRKSFWSLDVVCSCYWSARTPAYSGDNCWCPRNVSQVLERQKLLEAADGMAVAVGVGGLQGSNRQTDQKVSDQFFSKYMSLNTFCEWFLSFKI